MPRERALRVPKDNAAVDAARTKLSKRLTTLFVSPDRLHERRAKPATRCPGCGYWVQGTCSTCAPREE